MNIILMILSIAVGWYIIGCIASFLIMYSTWKVTGATLHDVLTIFLFGFFGPTILIGWICFFFRDLYILFCEEYVTKFINWSKTVNVISKK